MTSPMVVLAIGSLCAGGFLILDNRLVNFLGPGGRLRRRSATGCSRRSASRRWRWSWSGQAIAWAMYGRRPVPAVAPAGPVPGRRGAQGPVRGRVQRVGADAAGPVADQAVGVLRQPGRGRPGEYPRRHGGRHVGAAPPGADRVRPFLCPVHVRRRGAARRARCCWCGSKAADPMSTFPWLTVTGAIPLVGALVISVTPGASAPGAEADRRARQLLVKRLALVFSLVTLALTIAMMIRFSPGGPDFQFTQTDQWIPAVRRALRGRRGRHRAGADRPDRRADAGGHPRLLERRRC